jgi:hypothetical protein
MMECKDDKCCRQGKATWANGDVYVGQYVDWKRSGKGKMTYANGYVYDGDWLDDKRTNRK